MALLMSYLSVVWLLMAVEGICCHNVVFYPFWLRVHATCCAAFLPPNGWDSMCLFSFVSLAV
ncbi:hypothetical protein SLEP1_g33313 [Rubroshorea leprosula]|uniref:Secreted protein n=1 Tax=Rubroshorea leprosula TaxID=152421 RepID=A0AAV5KG97_9ROSI|nr:hypothetical protein SLEP1_g33313 [Rubroshorea leprosula]